MTMTDAEQDLLQDLDFATPCQAMPPEQRCPYDAVWTFVCDLCGGSGDTCQLHHDSIDAVMRNPRVALTECTYCHGNNLHAHHWEKK